MRNLEKEMAPVAARLEQIYQGIRCRVRRFEYEPNQHQVGHALWAVSFFANDQATLIKCGVATAEQFKLNATLSGTKLFKHPCYRDGFGGRISIYEWPTDDGSTWFEVSTLVTDYDNDERDFTKKLQGEVARWLRPFIRGTWKPRQPVS